MSLIFTLIFGRKDLEHFSEFRIIGIFGPGAFPGGRGLAGEDHRGEMLILAGRGHHWGLACVTGVPRQRRDGGYRGVVC